MSQLPSDMLRGFHDLMILSLLSKEDSYGYEMSETILSLSHGKYSVKETTLYSAINRLQKAGYIESYRGTQSQGRPRTYFRLVSTGKTYHQRLLTDWNNTKTLIELFVNHANKSTNTASLQLQPDT